MEKKLKCPYCGRSMELKNGKTLDYWYSCTECDVDTPITALCFTKMVGLSLRKSFGKCPRKLRNKHMNKARRISITKIADSLQALKSDVESIQSEEQDVYDNLPESFQDCERGDRMQEAIDNLDDALNLIDEAVTSLMQAAE